MSEPWTLDYDTANCTIGAAIGIIGEKWTFLVLREAFTGVRRFADIQRRTQAPRQILSDRLSRLVHEGLLRREPYQEAGQRSRHEYRLTDKGRDLYVVMTALLDWGDRYAAAPEGPSLALAHRGCGEPVHAQLACSAGHTLDSPREVSALPGPGARRVA